MANTVCPECIIELLHPVAVRRFGGEKRLVSTFFVTVIRSYCSLLAPGSLLRLSGNGWNAISNVHAEIGLADMPKVSIKLNRKVGVVVAQGGMTLAYVGKIFKQISWS